MTILVIDDEESSRELLQMILEHQGYLVLTAKSGEQGREFALREDPDLILLDIVMPDENGFETCKLLQQHPASSDIPIIFISGMNDVESKVTGLTIGGWDYVTKPFQRAEVEARVKNCLKSRFTYQQIIKEQAMRLQQVHEAQQAILPVPEEIPEAGFAVHYLPVLEAGGDFYDVFSIAKGIHGYFVSDISGHDLSASFATSALKALIRQNSSILHTPDETIRIINKVLRTIFKEGHHLTAVYATLNRTHNVLAVVNAGHLPMLFLPEKGEPYWVDPNCDILGAFDDAFFESRIISVNPGDRFYLFSDGLIESFQEPLQTRSQGMDKFMQAAKSFQKLPVAEASEKIFQVFSPHGHKFEDDVVLMGVDI